MTRRAKPARPGSGILLNFKEASLYSVLEYLSEAAGLVILEGAKVDGRITVMSRQPISTDEAVALLDTVLKEKGFAAIRTGRTLKIVPVAQAAKENLPVHSGSNPEDVPIADRFVTQVIPIRYVDATRLRTDLIPLIGTAATLTANQASNSLILIDTQTNIRRIMQIIRALDDHMGAVAEVKVYQLKYADASNTSRLITELFRQEQDQRQGQMAFMPFSRFGRGDRGGPGGGRGDRDERQGARQQRVIAAADMRTNSVVVTAPPELLKVIDTIIKELDSDPTEEQSVFIYSLKNAKATNLETVLNQIFSETTTTTRGRTTAGRTTTAGRISAAGRTALPSTAAGAGDMLGQVFVVADEDTNSLLVRTATKYVKRVKEILLELDRPIQQVLIKVLIAEVTHDKTTDLGAEFSALNIRIGSSTSSIGTDFNVASQAGGLITRVVDADYTVTLRALATIGKLNVLSRPYILASDNQEASITIGNEVPFIRNTRTTETGQTINTIEYEDIGIILNVTPHINPEGLVIMDVQPEISTLTGTTVPISETVNAEVFAKRSAETQVAIRNGQTIVIGGLMEDRETDTINKVPILGDIPHIGQLFQRSIKTKVKTELLIFLTPHVASEPDKLQKMSKQEAAGAKTVQGAPAGPGTYKEHMKGMRRGATTRPAQPMSRPKKKATSRPAGGKHGRRT
ncbi:MAG: hypothetical protein AMJ81_07705 [Phycisphaerae bacterium SM23_33]|nr:MAG: hypothetical protein AMJ81_07705 [Phycisphaerae bacterium SM23_33]